MIDYARLRTDLFALALLACTVFAALSLISFHPADPPSTLVFPNAEVINNLCGRIGAAFSYYAISFLGWGSYFLLGGLVLFVIQLIAQAKHSDRITRCLGWLLATFAVSTVLQMTWAGLGNAGLYGSGGSLGSLFANFLETQFSFVGSMILLGALFLAGLLLALEDVIFKLLSRVAGIPVAIGRRFLAMIWPAKSEVEIDLQSDETDDVDEELNDDIEEETGPPQRDPMPHVPFKVNPPITASKGGSVTKAHRELEEEDEVEFELPSLDLLEEAEEFPYELLASKAQVAAATLEQTFEEFGLNVKVAEIDTGPVVTQFELKLEKGLRVSKVTALADDLAIALRVPAVRVVSPIPGKNTVGVEVPNDTQVMVRMKELIEASGKENEKMRLPLFLGKDVSGRPMTVDLAKMPHLLIAGRTGTGKSVCLNTLILSLLMTRRPDQVRMLMIDPKMVELSPYMRIPHLMNPVITDMKKAEAVLAWAVEKMEERYDLLAQCGVRHLDSYNKMNHEERLERMGIDPDSPEADDVPENMPYIVIIADEMADMMMTSGKDVEGHIIRLAQKSRAVGLHLVLATQKPTVDVITGLIKSNLPARISFQVASRTDSRVVLDEMGAERLLGCGDMLYLAPGTSNLTRAQGTFVSDEEVNSVIGELGQYETQYSRELAQLSTAGGDDKPGLEGARNRDDLYQQAVEVVIREGRGSCSLLQRALGVGYGRAARMIDYMAEDGIVGDYNGSQAREVLYTIDQWEAMQAGYELEEVGV